MRVGEWSFLLATRKHANLFSQAFPMDGTHTQLDENNATIFILIRVSFYPCFHYPWLFSQAM